MEHCKLFIAQEANGSRLPKSVAAVSVDHLSDILTLTDAVRGLQNSVDALISVSTAQHHRIAKLKQCQKEADIYENGGNSSDDKDVILPSPSALALARKKLAGGGKERKKRK